MGWGREQGRGTGEMFNSSQIPRIQKKGSGLISPFDDSSNSKAIRSRRMDKAVPNPGHGNDKNRYAPSWWPIDRASASPITFFWRDPSFNLRVNVKFSPSVRRLHPNKIQPKYPGLSCQISPILMMSESIAIDVYISIYYKCLLISSPHLGNCKGEIA